MMAAEQYRRLSDFFAPLENVDYDDAKKNELSLHADVADQFHEEHPEDARSLLEDIKSQGDVKESKWDNAQSKISDMEMCTEQIADRMIRHLKRFDTIIT